MKIREGMLNEIYSESVKAFEGSKAYPTLFQERNNKFEAMKDELKTTVFKTHHIQHSSIQQNLIEEC